MAAHTHVAVGYNVQVAVDTKHKLIVEQQVTNQVLDMGLLTETAEPAKQILAVEQITVVADRGYFKIEDIEACEKAGMEPYMPRPQRGPSVRAGLFRKDEFAYDPETDTVICPGGQRLSPYSSSVLRGLKKINYVNKQACRDCPLRSRCTNNSFRSVSRMENEAVLPTLSCGAYSGVALNGSITARNHRATISSQWTSGRDCGHQSGLGCRGRGQSGECRHCRVGPIRALR